MKKLLLSMFIVLGTMVSVQAQSLSFDCGIEATGANFNISVNEVLDTAQINSLALEGYVMVGETGEEIIEKRTGAGERFYLSYGSFYYGGADGFQFGPVAYKVVAQFRDLDHRGGISYHQNAEYAIAALLQL